MFFSLNLLADNFTFGRFLLFPFIQALIIECWPLMARRIWVVIKNRKKNASCTPPSRSASLTSFPSPRGILEGEVTMPWRVASEQNIFAVNGDQGYTSCEVKWWSPSVRESNEYLRDLSYFIYINTRTWILTVLPVLRVDASPFACDLSPLFSIFFSIFVTLKLTENNREMDKINNFLLHFCRIIYWKCPAEKPGDGISETLNFKIFWGSMPPDPPSCKRLRCLQTISLSCVHLQKPKLHPWMGDDKHNVSSNNPLH